MKTFAAAYVNLLKTSIGSGVLSFPYLFKTYGIVSAVLLTVVSGFFATVGLVLLAVCSRDMGRSATLSRLASKSMPGARVLVDFAVFAKCFGVSLSYVIITKQLLPSVIDTLLNRKYFISSPHISLLVFLGFIGPFAYLTKLDRLKYTSFVGIFSILIVILASIFRYLGKSDGTSVRLFSPPSSGWLSGLGKFIFSFTCHQNIFAVNSEMVDNSLGRMKRLIAAVSLSSFVLYISFGLANYLLYGDKVLENVLNNYPKDYLAAVVRGLYVVVMGVSYPLQLAPARAYFLSMVGVSHEAGKYKMMHFLVTTALILLTYVLAISGARLGLVYSVVGATASCFMCLILPPLFYFRLEIERTVYLSTAGCLSFLFGILVFVLTLVSLIL